jgi:hypothetical protein
MYFLLLLLLLLVSTTNCRHLSEEETVSIMASVELDPRYVASVDMDTETTCAQVETFIRVHCEHAMGPGSVANTSKLEFDGAFCLIQFTCDESIIGNDFFLDTVPAISDISLDVPVIVSAPNMRELWGLDRLNQKDLPLDRSFSASHTGAGVRVYILDTGVFVEHEQFGGRAVYGANFVKEGDQDQNGHGTHVAGTAAGTNTGVARDATVVAVKVLGASGAGSSVGVARGILWAVDHAKSNGNRASVISMSLGGGTNVFMMKAAQAAAKAGHIVVVAAGNNGGDACDYSPANVGGSGKAGGVITVMSSDVRDVRSSFSNHGDCTDIIAPGSAIRSAWVGATGAYKTISGTSMAAPAVAGVAATLLEKHHFDKVAAVQELFATTAAGKIEDMKDSRIELVQVPTYTGPPTAPTRVPTSPPTATVVVLAIRVGAVMVTEWRDALFADARADAQVTIAGILARTPDKGCLRYDKDEYKGRIVMVERGDCTFYSKCKLLQDAGASAVIITQNSGAVIFNPAYSHDDRVAIPCAMINREDGRDLDAFLGVSASWGAPADADKIPSGLWDSVGADMCCKDRAAIRRNLKTKSETECADQCRRFEQCTHVNYRDPTHFNRNCQLLNQCQTRPSTHGYLGYTMRA